ncbi:MAG: amidohydrolase family protein [Dehalococcoidia bacterium]|nr:amidohydrolase family protein [Dehalococcoidia bacterium]
MIIDCHTHIFPREIIQHREQYLAQDANFAALYRNSNARLATIEELLDSMDNAGIDMSIVCGFAWSNMALCKQGNDYILEAISRYPQRLVGLVTVAIEEPSAAISELNRCAERGALGLGELRPPKNSLSTAIDKHWTPLVNTLTEKNLLCLMHASEPVGHQYPGKGNLTPERIYPFIKCFPNLKIILAHWGGGLPFYNLMPEVAKNLSNTWFDCAATSFLYDNSIYSCVCSLIDIQHVLFGSDYPLISQSRALENFHKSAIPPQLKSAILGENALKLIRSVYA